MEAVSGPTRLNGPSAGSAAVLSLPKSKDVNPLKIVESPSAEDAMSSEKNQADMDPYKELELYLAKVNEEIGAIIESAPPRRDDPPEKKKNNNNNSEYISAVSAVKETSSRSNSIRRQRQFESRRANDWSENILAEFNNIIANEISELTKSRSQSNDYRDLLTDLGIPNSDSGTEEDAVTKDEKRTFDEMKSRHQHMLSADYDEPRDQIRRRQRRISGSLPENLEYPTSCNGTSSNATSDYDEPSNCLMQSVSRSVAELRNNSSSLASSSPKSQHRNVGLPLKKPSTDPMPRSHRMLKAFARSRNNNLDDPRSQLPPQPFQRKSSLPGNGLLSNQSQKKTSNYGKIRKLKPSEAEPDYEEIHDPHLYEIIGRSKSLENNMPRSAPSTPTEVKRSPFSRLLKRHKHAPDYRDSSAEAILVRVSSLPDQDLVKAGTLRDTDTCRKKRAVSPLTLRSDVTAKRLSESDKDVTQISPVELRRFQVAKSNANDVAVSCDFPEVERSEVDEEPLVTKNNGDDKAIVDEQNSRSASLPISLQSILSRLTKSGGSWCPNSPPMEGLACSDMATQTSPAISRSSSFTWVSDCESPHHDLHADAGSLQDETILNPASPQNTVDDDNRSSSSSQDLLQSMDEISSGSLSPDTTDRASPLESGIGTASPPRSTDRRLVKPPTSSSTGTILPATNKCHRKETWERIRRRPSKLNSSHDQHEDEASVWVKRESVHTQTRSAADEERDYSQEAVDSSSGLDDSLPRTGKPARPNNLPLGLSTTASSSVSSGELVDTSLPRALSSPSTASLQLKTTEPVAIELAGKSTSAPLLDNNGSNPEKSVTEEPNRQQPRSQSERQLSEIEAQEACKWLRAAGFPQYAQMYEDYQFPIDVTGVAKDHPFLEADSLQSLFRRLHALNRCANMKLDTHHHHHHHTTHHNTSHGKSGGGGNAAGEDSDEDTQCALSENWTFEKKTRRWSRVCDISPGNVERLQAIAGQHQQRSQEDDSLDDRLEQDEADDTMLDTLRYRSLPPGALPDELGPRFRRTGSERLRDGAKAFLRRMESLKSRRRKTHHHNRDGVVISGPQVLDVLSMQQKMKDLNCVDVSPTEGSPPISFADLLPPPSPLQLQAPSPLQLPPSPFHLPPSPLAHNASSPFGDDSSSYCSDGSQGGGPTPTPTKTKMNRARRFLHRGNREDQGALSDSECQPTSWRHRYFKDANSNNTKVLEYVTSSPKDSPMKASQIVSSAAINTRGGSLNLGKESQRYRDKFSTSSQKEDKVTALKREEKFHKSFRHHRSNIERSSERSSLDEPIRTEKVVTKEVTVYRADKSRTRANETAASQESSSTVASRDSDQEEDSPRHKGSVVRWHSFQRGSLYPEPLDPLCPRAMASMSCGQLLVLRKLALLKLTACMERYCPTHRTGWNWELPKFIRKIKTPDYKDKTVFGVPLLLSLQRTGQALPKCIQIALRWLRANALDQVGIFRKSGVRSRIQKLKVMTETQGDNINFDGQQAFDVADLVKQYFRELPEALLTNKLSETFIAIFQHVPVELRPDAVQCVLLLLPDEHREALETLLDFLNHVASNSPYNQMTASNLAVCLAPSLFHFNHSNANVSSNRSNSVSPRRRKTVGIPDQRELSENKAAHDCLLYLIKTHRELFMVSSDMLTQCHFNYMEESVPVPLEELGSELKQDWRGYLYACTTALLKEGREKSRGWVSVNNPADANVDMAYKKVGDGHPLRLWRVTTEVEAPPEELLHRVLRERHIWDPQLLKYRQVAKLEANVEVFQYATGNMSPLPARDYCVLRSWQTDLPKKACVIVETSVEHPDAPVMLGGTRGIVLASRYLIEHCGSGRSRIMHLSRVDTKGRTPEWYNKSYGHIAALHLSKIRSSFKHTTDGPESKV
ncbi:stAR-related lipid transfer protein 13 isoform X2 [Nasonia vitripennis]|uniref:Rho GTPase-activating protein 7 n=1 Tax=Nasonia vitripennis TaxID=7425 RepID=A0A7M7Q555_NASVI|nr:stAR-related lipid transfer protein 13 isoform X2 [Nasonia vitripennis]